MVRGDCRADCGVPMTECTITPAVGKDLKLWAKALKQVPGWDSIATAWCESQRVRLQGLALYHSLMRDIRKHDARGVLAYLFANNMLQEFNQFLETKKNG